MEFPFIPIAFERLSVEESRSRIQRLLGEMRHRRTVRDFASDPVPIDIIETAIQCC